MRWAGSCHQGVVVLLAVELERAKVQRSPAGAEVPPGDPIIHDPDLCSDAVAARFATGASEQHAVQLRLAPEGQDNRLADEVPGVGVRWVDTHVRADVGFRDLGGASGTEGSVNK